MFRGWACDGPVEGLGLAVDGDDRTVDVYITADRSVFLAHPPDPADVEWAGPVVAVARYRWCYGVWFSEDATTEPAGAA